MASPGEEGHPVNSDGNRAVLVVKVVDVVRGAEAGGDARRARLYGQHREQGDPESQSQEVAQAHGEAEARLGSLRVGRGLARSGGHAAEGLEARGGEPRGRR